MNGESEAGLREKSEISVAACCAIAECESEELSAVFSFKNIHLSCAVFINPIILRNLFLGTLKTFESNKKRKIIK